jgi:hypothetical protein
LTDFFISLNLTAMPEKQLSEVVERPIPQVSHRTVTAPMSKPLMAAVLAYCQFTDVTKSRLVQRGVQRELARQMEQNPKLKARIKKVLKHYGATLDSISHYNGE